MYWNFFQNINISENILIRKYSENILTEKCIRNYFCRKTLWSYFNRNIYKKKKFNREVYQKIFEQKNALNIFELRNISENILTVKFIRKYLNREMYQIILADISEGIITGKCTKNIFYRETQKSCFPLKKVWDNQNEYCMWSRISLNVSQRKISMWLFTKCK